MTYCTGIRNQEQIERTMKSDRIIKTSRAASLACLLVLCVISTANQAKAEPGDKASRQWSNWVESQDAFPVGAWVLPGTEAAFTGEAKQRYLDAGFTLLPVPGGDAKTQPAGAGVPVAVWDRKAELAAETVLPQLMQLLSGNGSAVAFLGQEAEPGSFEQLAKIHSEIYQLSSDGDVLPLGSLFPNWYMHFGRHNMTYERYVEHYIKKAKPAALMATHFALLSDGSDRLWFYDNLETLRRQGLDAGIGLFGQVQSAGHGQRYREPSASDIRWQVNSYIAYGAKGVWHYYYSIDKDQPTDGLFTGVGWYPKSFTQDPPGPGLGETINDTGSQRFNAVAQINQRLHTIWPVLKNLESVGVYHADAKPPVGTAALKDRADTSQWGFAGEGFLIGEFRNARGDNDDSIYLYIVNKKHGSVSNEVGMDAAFTVSVPSGRIVEVVGDGEPEAITVGNDPGYRISLPGGAAVLLRVGAKSAT